MSRGLNAIVLAPGAGRYDGYYGRGVVHVCARNEDWWIDFQHNTTFFDAHKPIFGRLGVPMQPAEDGYTLCQFTPSTARAYQLLHILLHELGHHHDRLTTKPQGKPNRGEPYAEAYALQYEAQIWERYQEAFGLLSCHTDKEGQP